MPLRMLLRQQLYPHPLRFHCLIYPCRSLLVMCCASDVQSSTISATEGQRITSLTITTLLKMRTDERFTLFWNLVQKKAGSFDVSEPSPPRPRKFPKRFKTIGETVHFPATVEAYYSQIYFEVLDYSVCSIKARFDQPGYQMFRKVEDLL